MQIKPIIVLNNNKMVNSKYHNNFSNYITISQLIKIITNLYNLRRKSHNHKLLTNSNSHILKSTPKGNLNKVSNFSNHNQNIINHNIIINNHVNRNFVSLMMMIKL